MAEDQAHFADGMAEYVTHEEIMIWESLPEFGTAPAEPAAVVQVIEFEVHGDERAVMHGISKFTEAVEAAGGGGNIAWSRVVSADRPPTYFVAIFAESFAQLGTPGPDPATILTQAYGVTEAEQLMQGFSAAARTTSQRIWIYRPDLSYAPGA